MAVQSFRHLQHEDVQIYQPTIHHALEHGAETTWVVFGRKACDRSEAAALSMPLIMKPGLFYALTVS